MKILAIGDFHGKFPVKLKNLVKKEKIDLVVSPGDYMPFSYRKMWFKYCYGKEVELWEIIGKKKMREMILKDLKKGEEVLKKLNKVGVRVITTVGNLDYTHVHDTFDLNTNNPKGSIWKWAEQDFFTPMIKKYKNIKRVDYKNIKIKGLVFIGAYGHTFPGNIKSKSYKKYKGILQRIFKKFSKENRKNKVIFVSHNMPYNTKLDKIKSEDADKRVQGKHYGSRLIKSIINKYQPVLSIGGHMHENFGKFKIKNSLILNPGAVVDGRAAIIDFNEEKGKVNGVKFIK